MIKLAIVGVLAGLALVVGLLATLVVLVASRPALAQTPDATPSGPTAQGMPTHELMHQMMGAMHGEGASQRMHDAMGPDAEQMIDQCTAMMGMMQGAMHDEHAEHDMMQGMMSMQGMHSAMGH